MGGSLGVLGPTCKEYGWNMRGTYVIWDMYRIWKLQGPGMEDVRDVCKIRRSCNMHGACMEYGWPHMHLKIPNECLTK